MDVIRNWENYYLESSAVTIGTFDGVHLAHQGVIQELIDKSRELGVPSVLITFDPHPRTFVSKPHQEPIKTLSSPEEKLRKLESMDLDKVVIINFDRKFSQLSADDFIQKIVVEHLHPEYIIIGYDHKFGKGRQGDIKLLRDNAEKYGYKVEEVPQFYIDDEVVNSTQIRRYIANGEMTKVVPLLGHPYRLCGIVVKGMQKGRLLGYPTANIRPLDSEKILPRDGVYKVDVLLDGNSYRGALNLGYRPSVDDQLTYTIEVYILDFDKDIYGKEICIDFLEFIRPEMKFDSIEDLKKQIKKDVELCR